MDSRPRSGRGQALRGNDKSQGIPTILCPPEWRMLSAAKPQPNWPNEFGPTEMDIGNRDRNSGFQTLAVQGEPDDESQYKNRSEKWQASLQNRNKTFSEPDCLLSVAEFGLWRETRASKMAPCRPIQRWHAHFLSGLRCGRTDSGICTWLELRFPLLARTDSAFLKKASRCCS